MAMIKCPECGHSVSDKAAFCPSCGVRLNGESDSSGRPSEGGQCGGGSKDKKKRGNGRYVLAAALLVILALCIGGGWLYNSMRESEKETAEYEFALSSSDTTTLKRYLEAYQDAPAEHQDAIRRRIAELRRTDQEWTDAVVRGTKSAIMKYLEAHPNSSHMDEAERKLDSIDWKTAQDANTVTAYQTYMRERPDGEYFDQASEALRTLNTKTVQPEEEMMVSQLFRNFYKSLNDKDEDALTATVATVLTSFLGKSNATKADVLTFMNKIYKSDVTLMSWHTDGDYNIKKKEIGDEKYEYSVEFSAVQDVSRSDGSSTRNNYKVRSKVDPDGKIIEYNMTRLLE